MIVTDPSKPDGTMRKVMNVDRLGNLGWRAKIERDEGIAQTYSWFLENFHAIRD